MINAIKNVKNIANSFNQQVLKIIEMNAANPQDLRIISIRLSYCFGKKREKQLRGFWQNQVVQVGCSLPNVGVGASPIHLFFFFFQCWRGEETTPKTN